MAAAAIGAGVALATTAVSVRESQLAKGAAEEASAANKLAPLPAKPLNAELATQQQVQKASLLAQTAGASLLSDPSKDRGGGRQIGSAPQAAKSLLG